jgi:hypothetical protein
MCKFVLFFFLVAVYTRARAHTHTEIRCDIEKILKILGGIDGAAFGMCCQFIGIHSVVTVVLQNTVTKARNVMWYVCVNNTAIYDIIFVGLCDVSRIHWTPP